jgi:hypothetical protein
VVVHVPSRLIKGLTFTQRPFLGIQDYAMPFLDTAASKEGSESSMTDLVGGDEGGPKLGGVGLQD